MRYLPPLREPVRTIGRRRFDFDREIVVMGIVNRTPDSFFDQGRTYAIDRAVDAALAAAQAGAGWVDIGGVPFSPDTPEVSAAEDLEFRSLSISEEGAEHETFYASLASCLV